MHVTKIFVSLWCKDYLFIKNISVMKKVKSAKVSMLVFIAHGLLKKVEYINFDYIAWLDMLLLVISLITFIYNRDMIHFAIFVILFTLVSLPFAALIQLFVRSLLKSFYN